MLYFSSDGNVIDEFAIMSYLCSYNDIAIFRNGNDATGVSAFNCFLNTLWYNAEIDRVEFE
ncbi:hypothetical protein SEEN554_06965 [Salmonella enterica subsp. enterica serovar Newport str. CVM 21554]|nr:hypothetical protein SEEN554_06965 [Salmonella enterica subsp. enterica serovar Newport str. CVM 21554]